MIEWQHACDTIAVDSKKWYIDPISGRLHIPFTAAKEGIHVYQNKGGKRRFLPATVLNQAKDSLAYVPVTRLHPEAEEVTIDNIDDLKKGLVKEKVWFKNKRIGGMSIIENKILRDEILSKTMVEVSPGYRFQEDDVFGSNKYGEFDSTVIAIIYNHVAVVPRGKGGPEIRMEVDHQGKTMGERKETLSEYKIGNDSVLPKCSITYDEGSQTAIDAMGARESTLIEKINLLQTDNTRLQTACDAGDENLKKAQTAQDSMINADDVNAMVSDLVEARQFGEKIALDAKILAMPKSHDIKLSIIEKLLPGVYAKLQERKHLTNAVAVDSAYLSAKDNAGYNIESFKTRTVLQQSPTPVSRVPDFGRGCSTLENM